MPLRMYPAPLGPAPVTAARVADPFRAHQAGPELRPEIAADTMVLVSDIDQSDLIGFPIHWKAMSVAERTEALSFLDRAAGLGKPVLVWTVGDREFAVDHPAAIRFQLGGAKRRRSLCWGVEAYPPFIEDELYRREGRELPTTAIDTDRPTIAFCGQGETSLAAELKLLVTKAQARLSKADRQAQRLAEPWASHLRLREKALAALANDPRIDHRFVVRRRYRAGVQTKAERRDPLHPTSVEFFDNLATSQYALCVRGGGNFSVRFFEALCFGRIPVLVDTDCRLPAEDKIDWDQIILRLPDSELSGLGHLVVEHHRRLGPDGVREHQHRCRQVWLDHLSRPGYLSQLPDLLKTHLDTPTNAGNSGTTRRREPAR